MAVELQHLTKRSENYSQWYNRAAANASVDATEEAVIGALPDEDAASGTDVSDTDAPADDFGEQ